jgi:hypothetical protein
MLGFFGVTAMDWSVAGVTVSVVDPETLPIAAETVVEPDAKEVAKPLDPAALLIAATPAVDDVQATAAVRSCVVVSEYIPVATNCWTVPRAILGFFGVTAIDWSVAGVTVSVVDPETLPIAAETVVEPAAIEVATPFEPAVLLMVATSAVDDIQVTAAVRSCVVASEYIPVALKCCTVPRAMLEFVGVTVMDWSVAGVTVSVVYPETLPIAAETVVEPAAIEVTTPFEPSALLMVATPAVDDVHVTVAVKSWVVLSEKVPVAVNCRLVPSPMLEFVGVTAMDTSVAGLTRRLIHPDTLPKVTLIVVSPACLPCIVIRPGAFIAAAVVPAELIVAMVVSVESHAASDVKSRVVLSE